MSLWLFLALAPMQILSVYRIARLMTVDEFPPVLWFRDRVVGGWRDATEAEHDRYAQANSEERGKSFTHVDRELQFYAHRSKWSNAFLAKLFSCPFCLSFWISCAVILGSWFCPTGVVVPVLTLFSAWAVGGWLAAQEWS